MKKVIGALTLALFMAAGVIGCETTTHIDDHDHDTYYKKTTVKEPDGDTKVKTEIRRDN